MGETVTIKKHICEKQWLNWKRKKKHCPGGFEEEDILISSMHFCIKLLSLLENRAGHFISTNLNPIYPRMFCSKFGWNWPTDLLGEHFSIAILLLSPLGKGQGPFNWTNLNPIYPRMLCAKFGWKWTSVSRLAISLLRVGALHLNKLESPSHYDALW